MRWRRFAASGRRSMLSRPPQLFCYSGTIMKQRAIYIILQIHVVALIGQLPYALNLLGCWRQPYACRLPSANLRRPLALCLYGYMYVALGVQYINKDVFSVAPFVEAHGTIERGLQFTCYLEGLQLTCSLA